MTSPMLGPSDAGPAPPGMGAGPATPARGDVQGHIQAALDALGGSSPQVADLLTAALAALSGGGAAGGTPGGMSVPPSPVGPTPMGPAAMRRQGMGAFGGMGGG